ncbi:MAG TPA: ATP-binding cassette domain-containing protein [Microbacteriaceae bacterium]|nr:ATP-binding cassette domain-containing protein [Microbacteriaceae bacterium]
MMRAAQFDQSVGRITGGLIPGRPLVVGAGLFIVAIALVPNLVNSYWLGLLTSGLIYVVVFQSLGILTGRLGALALCQITFVGIGAWMTQWAGVSGVPGGFLVWLLLGGLVAVPAGVIVGAAALRLRGPMLAVATFALATTSAIFWSAQQFPGQVEGLRVALPEWLPNSRAYFIFIAVLVVLVFILLQVIDRSRVGASWMEIKYSERAATAHGISVAGSKLLAFAISAGLAGIAGGLMVGQYGSVRAESFTAVESVAVFALAIMLGVRHAEAALMSGLFYVLFPVLLELVKIPKDIAGVIFAVLAFFALKAGGGTMGQHDLVRASLRARREKKRRQRGEPAPPRPAELQPQRSSLELSPRPSLETLRSRPVVLQADGLGVTFGTVKAITDVHFSLHEGEVLGLIGPNGAGKSTIINALTGFVPTTGSVRVRAGLLDGVSANRRAKRYGIRRSFQHLQVAPDLKVGAYVRLVAGRRLTDAEVDQYLAWFDCPRADAYIESVDLGSRRILEVAGLAASGADVLLLDEPAAGQGAEESHRLGRAIRSIPERTGSSVLLVEHDMALVRDTCDSLIVMAEGSVLAEGTPEDVLALPEVIEVYLGQPVGASEPNSNTPPTNE